MIDEELIMKVSKCISKNHKHCRYIDENGDRLILGIESTKLDALLLLRDLKALRLVPVNIVYGRWVFNYHG